MRSAVPRWHFWSLPGWRPVGLRPCSWPRSVGAPCSGSSAERRGGGWRGRGTAHGPAGPAISPTEVPGKTRPGGLPIEPRTAVIPTAKAEPWRRDRRRRRNELRLGPGRGCRAGAARPSNVTRILAGSPVHRISGPRSRWGRHQRCPLPIDRVTEAALYTVLYSGVKCLWHSNVGPRTPPGCGLRAALAGCQIHTGIRAGSSVHGPALAGTGR